MRWRFKKLIDDVFFWYYNWGRFFFIFFFLVDVLCITVNDVVVSYECVYKLVIGLYTEVDDGRFF